MCQTKQQTERSKTVWLHSVRCVLRFTICFPTYTAVHLSEGEDGLLRGENCTGQLNIERDVVAVVRKEYKALTIC